jgi:hypothetical protein
MNYLESFAKYAGLTTICFEWLAFLLFFLLRPDMFNGQYPISYFAAQPETRIIFSVCLTIAATSFWVFTRFHLNKHYVTPVRLFTASMIGYAALALLPFDPTNSFSDLIHRLLAMFFSLTFLGGIFIMGKNNKALGIQTMSYLTAALSVAVMIVFLLTPKDSPHVMLLEALSAFVGQVWVVWISFHAFRVAKNQ